MKRIMIIALLAALGCLTLAPRPAQAQTGDVRDVPDPAIIEHDDQYYIFSTAAGLPIRRSDDLMRWEIIDTVFDTLPDWTEEEVPGVEFPWAPDIAHFGGRYHLYYSLSTFGSQRSAIGLATNQTLDPGDPDYEWVDRGKVIASRPGDDFNAIDPNVAYDEDGQPWMAWGSHWGGIRMRKLNAETGLPSEEDTTTYALASRPDDPVHAIEAPYIIRRGDFYYLFVSFDQCCQGAESTYKVMVGRSEDITGPYMDQSGQPMMEGGGTLVLAGDETVRGPGHNAILTDDDGQQYIVHHYVNVEEGPASPDQPLAIPRSLQIRPLRWKGDGWPTAGAPLTTP